MKTLTELAQENSARLDTDINITFQDEEDLKKCFDAYCKQLSEPIYQLNIDYEGWRDTDNASYKRCSNVQYRRIVYLAPQQAQIPSEVTEYIVNLEYRLAVAAGVLESSKEYLIAVDSINRTLATKPDCLKD